MKRSFFAGVAAMALAAVAGCASSTADIAAVQDFDVERYMGVWYEIARLPHFFERDMDEVRAEYSLNADGTVKVLNSGVRRGERREAVGVAKWKDSSRRPLAGELRVSFFGPFYSDYRVIELSPDYSCAVVTGSSRDYLWILARTPELPRERLDAVLRRLDALGFAVEKLEYPRHTAAESGSSGAASP